MGRVGGQSTASRCEDGCASHGSPHVGYDGDAQRRHTVHFDGPARDPPSRADTPPEPTNGQSCRGRGGEGNSIADRKHTHRIQASLVGLVDLYLD